MSFGRLLRAARRDRNLTQRDLAEVVGVDFTYVSKLENDRIAPPAAETVERFARALGIDPDDLLAAGGKVPPGVGEHLGSQAAAVGFLREASAMDLSDSEWDHLRRQLKGLRS